MRLDGWRNLVACDEAPATAATVGVALVIIAFTSFTADLFMVVKIALFALTTFVLTLLNARRAIQGHFRWAPMPIMKWVGLYLATVIAATAFSRSPLRSLVGGYERFGGLFTIVVGIAFAANVVLAVAGSISRFNRVLFGLEFAATIASAYAIFQHFGIDHYEFREQAGNLAKWPGSTLGNSNFLGGFLAIVLPIALRRITTNANGKYRTIAIIAAALDVIALWFSQSRGGMIAALIGIATLAVARSVASDQRRRRFSVAALVASLGLFGLAASAIASPWTTHLPGPLRKLDMLRSESATVRGWEWRAAIVATGHRPIFGNGPDTYLLAYPSSRVRDDGANLGLLISDKPHNLLLEQFATIGIVGTTAWFVMLAMIGRSALHKRRTLDPHNSQRLLLETLGAALVAYWAQSLFSFDVPPIAMVSWLLLGGVVALTHGETLLAEPAATRSATKSRRVTVATTPRSGSVLGAATACAVASGVAALAAGSWLYADIRVHFAQADLARKDFAGAAESYAAAVNAAPYIAEYRRAAATGAQQIGLATRNRQTRKDQFDQADSYLADAIRIEPGNIGYLVARGQLTTFAAVAIDGRLFEDANRNWRKAVAADPHDVELRRAFSRALGAAAAATRDNKYQIESAAQLAIVTNLRPLDDYAWLSLGQQQLVAKQYDEAIQSAQRANQLRPTSAAVQLIFEVARRRSGATTQGVVNVPRSPRKSARRSGQP